MKYGKVYTYDLWGSRSYGWDVNDVRCVGSVEVSAEDGYEAWDAIRKQLVEKGILQKGNRTIMPDKAIDNSHTIYLVSYAVKDGGYKPVGEIRPLED